MMERCRYINSRQPGWSSTFADETGRVGVSVGGDKHSNRFNAFPHRSRQGPRIRHCSRRRPHGFRPPHFHSLCVGPLHGTNRSGRVDTDRRAFGLRGGGASKLFLFQFHAPARIGIARRSDVVVLVAGSVTASSAATRRSSSCLAPSGG